MLRHKLKLKTILYVEVALLLIFIAAKIYLLLFESNFYSLNAKAISRIKTDKQNISFAVLGNIKNSRDVFHTIVRQLNNSKPDFVISLGNSVLDGGEDKYRVLYKSVKQLSPPIIFVPGPNDVIDNGRLRFYNHFGPFNFTFHTKNAFFIALDTTDENNILWQKQWLLRVLRDAQKYKYRFVFMSTPPFEIKGIPGVDFEEHTIENKDFASFLRKTFSKYNVTTVFAGDFEISEELNVNNVKYIITGGAGGGLYIDAPKSFHHYVTVSLADDRVSYNVVRAGEHMSVISKLFTNIFFYLHSVFYVNFGNYLILLMSLLVAGLFIYIKTTEKVDYYNDYNLSPTNLSANKKLTIAMFTNVFLPFVGGVPISVQRLSEGLRKQGHTVYIFAPRYPEAEPSDDKYIIRCEVLSYYKKAGIIIPVTNIYSPAIKNIFKKLNVDIVHAHHPYWLGEKALKLAKRFNLPVVFTYHTRLEKYAHNIPLLGKLFENKIPHYIIKRFAQKCNAVFAPTGAAKEYLRNIGVSRHIQILPTGVDLSLYSTITDNDILELRKKYHITDEIILFSAARLSKEKNLYFMLKGIKKLAEKSNVKFKCLIAGDGPEKTNAEHFIEKYGLTETVILTGSLNETEMIKHYKLANLFIFSSLSETQGMVLLEAMAAGCPVVAVSASGINDMIEQGVTGYKTKNDVDDWTEKILSVINDKPQLDTLSKNALRFAEKYSLESVAKEAYSAYITVINRK